MNANEVLMNVEKMLETAYNGKRWAISDVHNKLGIFDWWNENLSVSQLKQMKDFLEKAIARGFAGYVCFKVGAKYCAHGMWAHKAQSTNGYSPDGACLYHSFRSGDNYWDMCDDDGNWLSKDGKYEFTLKEIDTALVKGVAA